ncbi:MAG TPA: ImmA/IrrE family metallo-endopeptidase [Vicinamibacterales bacterium]|nr:ImmA/IrrE family metallo-endopeptidase [Vicinamibacterales bacterium]
MDILNIDVPVRVIESEVDYSTALEQMAELMASEPAPNSDAERLLKTLAVLVRDYESARYPVVPPDPIEAIKFRMEQQGLAPKDLIPYLGSRSRVSEVLAKKRPLTLSMIRSLHRGLGIPAASLLSDRGDSSASLELDLMRVPFAEMRKLGWIDHLPRDASGKQRILDSWMSSIRMLEFSPLYRRHVRSAKSVDQERLYIWTIQVAKMALEHPPVGKFDPTWSLDFMREVARISAFKDGPSLVKEFLGQHGILMLVVPTLSPWLDGAAMMCRNVPVIALTLRHNRLDNFWFVLMHELVHLFKHLGPEAESFYDDLDSDDQADPKEIEADHLAAEALIPSSEWQASPASKLRSADAARHLAQRLKIHEAIVAGRIRKAYKDYRVLSGMVGQGEVRRHFPEFEG